MPKPKGQGQSTSDPESCGGTFKHRMASITQSHKSPQISHSKFALPRETHGNLVSLFLPVNKVLADPPQGFEWSLQWPVIQ